MTSTLQQEASRKLRYSAQTTMRVAQRLYENGYITYMRTDSTTLSESALTAARNQARDLYGADYVPDEPRRYERKVKNAQEAHEAIRPAGDVFRMPKDVARELNRDENALYELIWMRTIASQMKDAAGQTVSLRIGATSSSGEQAEFGASGTVITFRGFLAAYEEGRDTDRVRRRGAAPPEREARATRSSCASSSRRDTRRTRRARYTEATLVRTLEELGIGRPSTYASIIGTILDRGYVFKKGTALVPSFLAFSVVNLLKEHFTRLVDYGFTASMEDDLDRIASGDQDRLAWLNGFYFGVNDHKGLQELVSDLGAIDAREINSIELGNGIVLRVGRYGPYLERDGQRANVPEDIVPDELTVEKAEELLAAAVRRPRARHRSRDRPRDRRAHRPLRPVRHRDARGGLEGEAAHGVALQVDGARHGHARGGAAAAVAPARRRRVRGRRGDGAERPLRAVRPEGQGVALARDARSSSSRSRSTTRSRARAAAPAPRRPAAGGAAEGGRRRSGQRQADCRQVRPLRPLRHRRRDEREPPRAATTPRGSRSTVRSSCSPTAAPAARRRRRSRAEESHVSQARVLRFQLSPSRRAS